MCLLPSLLFCLMYYRTEGVAHYNTLGVGKYDPTYDILERLPCVAHKIDFYLVCKRIVQHSDMPKNCNMIAQHLVKIGLCYFFG